MIRKFIEAEELSITDRGDGGFGSTGSWTGNKEG